MFFFKGFDTNDIPDLAGKVFLITGGTAGIGKTTILELSRHNPGHIYFTGRNVSAAEALIASCACGPERLTFIRCDHASLASVAAAAERFTHDRLDVLVANAGIFVAEPATSADGIEVHLATNHLGNAAMLLRLLPVMLRTPGARFVSVTSAAYNVAPKEGGILFDDLRTTQPDLPWGKWARYGQSKLANVLFARALADRYCGNGKGLLASVALHPGIVDTPMVRGLDWMSRWGLWLEGFGYLNDEQGACSILWAATAPDLADKVAAAAGSDGKGPALFLPVGAASEGSPHCRDDELAEKLWKWTEEVVGVKAPEAENGA